MAKATSILGCTQLTHATHVYPHLGVPSSSFSSSKHIITKTLLSLRVLVIQDQFIILTESATHAMLRVAVHTLDEDWLYETGMEIHTGATICIMPTKNVTRTTVEQRALRSRLVCIQRLNNVCSDGRMWNVGREAINSIKKGRKSVATCSLILLFSISTFHFLFTWCTLFCADWKWNRKFSGLLNGVIRLRCIEINAGHIENEYRDVLRSWR